MKTLLNVLFCIALFAGIAFGLSYFGVLTFNIPSINVNSNIVVEEEGMLLNTGTFESMPEDSEIETINAQPDIVKISYPYSADNSITGDFVKLGITSNDKELYVYRVKLGGTTAGVESKRIEYAKLNDISTGAEVNYVDENGALIGVSESLDPGQLIYLEVSGNMGTTTSSSTTSSTDGSIVVNATSVSCTKYQKFFECVVSKTSGIDQRILSNQLSAYFSTISNLTEDEQDAKCTNLIYEAKTISDGNSSSAGCSSLLE